MRCLLHGATHTRLFALKICKLGGLKYIFCYFHNLVTWWRASRNCRTSHHDFIDSQPKVRKNVYLGCAPRCWPQPGWWLLTCRQLQNSVMNASSKEVGVTTMPVNDYSTSVYTGLLCRLGEQHNVVVTTAAGELVHAMAQAVSRRPVIKGSGVQSQASRCEICGGQSTAETRFSPSTSVFPCPYRSTDALCVSFNDAVQSWQLTASINNTVQEPSPAVTPVQQSSCSSKNVLKCCCFQSIKACCSNKTV